MLARRGYRLSCWIAGFFSCLLFCWAPLSISVLLGPKWIPAIDAINIMAFTALLVTPVAIAGVLLTASGKAQWIALGTVAQLAALVATMGEFTRIWGLRGAAAADACAIISLAGVLLAITRREFPLAKWIDAKQTMVMLIALSPAAVTGLALAKWFPNHLLLGGIAGGVGTLLYPLISHSLGAMDADVLALAKKLIPTREKLRDTFKRLKHVDA